MKLRTWCIRIGHILTKTGSALKMSLLLMLVCFANAALAELDTQGITIRQQNASLEKVFQSIEKQTGYRFFYNESLLEGAGKVSLNLQNVSLQDALDACFRDQPFSYAIVERTIIVKRKGAVVSSTASNAQLNKIIAVSGKVTSNDKPVVGATVTVKGTENATSTDNDGVFTLSEVDDQGVLVVSHVAHEAREVRLKGQRFIAIDLEGKVSDLDEAVVVAYNTTTQKRNTGAVTVVKGEQIATLPNTSVDKSLQGLVPGLLVTSGSGQPGSGLSNFVLRGIATGDNGLSGSTLRNPLIVVDGIPVSQDPQQLRVNGITDVPINNPLAQLNPSDIESISVLKDAAAIALYGSKASNGVILITTQKGKAGKATFSIRSQTDIAQQLPGKIKFLNEDEYMELLLETYKNTYPTATTDSIMGVLKKLFPLRVDGSFYPFQNLADQVYNKNAITTSNELSVSGGNGRSLYYLSLEWTKQNGTYRKTGYDRKSLRFNFENRVTDWLKIGMNNGLSYNQQDYSMIEGGYSYGLVNMAAPLMPVYLESGDYLMNYTIPYSAPNPIASMQYNFSRNTSYRALSKLYGELSFLKYFKLSANIGVDFQLTEAKERRDPRLYDPKIGSSSIGSGRITEGEFRNANLITTNILSFNKQFPHDHSVNALIGEEAQILTQKNITAEGTGIRFITNDQISNTATRTSDGSFTKQTLLSYFGQVNYDYKRKYFFSSSARFDASSKFGSKQRFGTYWSAGLGWIISAEPFMDFSKNWLNFLKIRSSVGMAGNSGAINKYTKYSMLNTANYLNASTIAIYPLLQPFNPNIKWEETFTWDAGLETKIWKERIGITIDIYKRKTSNLIYLINLPYATGYTSTYGNLGDIDNKGLEISLSATLIRTRDFNWNIAGNWSTNTNKLIKSNVPFVKVTGGMLANEEGRNLNSYYMPVWAGVDPATGLGQWIDSSGKPTTNYKSAMSQFVGKPQPDGFGTVTNTFTYKDIQLSAQLYYQYGYQVYVNPDFISDGARPFSNQTREALDRWQQSGDIVANPKRTLNNANASQLSTRRLYDGDHIRLQNLMVAYMIPKTLVSAMRLQSVRVYAQANNIAVWTKAKGNDVSDVTIQGQTGLGYPNQRTISLGVNLNF